MRYAGHILLAGWLAGFRLAHASQDLFIVIISYDIQSFAAQNHPSQIMPLGLSFLLSFFPVLLFFIPLHTILHAAAAIGGQ